MEPKTAVEITAEINGREVVETISPNTLLSKFLREQLQLTGTHRGCETAKCGACTVLIDGEAAKSCNVLAVQVDGSQVTTVEGLADGADLHPVQEALWENHGMQCGYCTPGFVMSSAALLEDNEDPSVSEIQAELAGNICRCTGYTKIVEGVKDAATRLRTEEETS
jgi:carbon-monoxide dehydrogenase small subunit